MSTFEVCCDMGEGYGNWRYGDDEAIMPYISSINLATGGHAGDPMIMEKTIDLAVEHGLAIGAHPGFPDKLNFGRRVIPFEPFEFAAILTYQIGALQGFLKVKGQELHHVLPHGATYNYIRNDDAVGEAAAKAIHAVAPGAIAYWPAPTDIVYTQTLRSLGHTVIPLVVADMKYTPEGVILIERKKAMTDIDLVRAQVENVLTNSSLLTQGGEPFPVEEVKGILFHSDGPNAVDVAKAIQEEVQRSGSLVGAS